MSAGEASPAGGAFSAGDGMHAPWASAGAAPTLGHHGCQCDNREDLSRLASGFGLSRGGSPSGAGPQTRSWRAQTSEEPSGTNARGAGEPRRGLTLSQGEV